MSFIQQFYQDCLLKFAPMGIRAAYRQSRAWQNDRHPQLGREAEPFPL